MKIKLNNKLINYLLSIPESGMGYQKVDITLNNGREIKNLIVLNAEILELPDKYNFIKLKNIKDIKLHKINK
jgi:hypothetical protein